MNPEIAVYEALAKELLRRCMAEDDPTDLRQWLTEQLDRLGGGEVDAVMSWVESFDLVDRMMDDYERLALIPPGERRLLTWPWQTWNNLIDPLDDGMLGVITAPDGAGKTIYAESIAEHWARQKNRVAFVHYELNRKLMMLRRTARHTSILTRDIKSGRLTAEQRSKIAMVRPALTAWDGCITYL